MTQLATQTISLTTLETHVQRLAQQVQSSSFAPDCVLYIERAGRIPGILIARQLSCLALPAQAARSGRSLKHRFRHFLNALPQALKTLLRRLELTLGLQERAPERQVSIPPQMVDFRDVLIVDDAIDTGQSVLQVKAALQALRAEQPLTVKVAVITTTASRGKESVLRPDYVLFRRTIVQFPWSSDSSEYNQFLRWYDEIGKAA